MESIGVASGCGQQDAGVASGNDWNLWVWLAEGGCGWNLRVWLVGVVVRRYNYKFPHVLIFLHLLYLLFWQHHPYFLFTL